MNKILKIISFFFSLKYDSPLINLNNRHNTFSLSLSLQNSEEDGITMWDVLQDEEAMEEDAKAVLGNADDKNCSYHSGGNEDFAVLQLSYLGLYWIPGDFSYNITSFNRVIFIN